MKIVRQLALALGLAALVACSWLAPLDAPAMQQVDAGLKKAVVSFATARAINGVISVLQGTSIAVGVTVPLGQVLAPFNDLVRDFSNLMLLATVSFGIQKVLISISGYWAVSLILTVAAFGWASFHLRQRQSPGWLAKILVILLMLRFAIPVATLGADFLSQKFLGSDYAASQMAIDKALGQVTAVNPPIAPAAAGDGWWKKMQGALPNIPNFSAVKDAVDQAAEHIVKLMVVFLLQTLLLPLLMLWGLYGVARGVYVRPRQLSHS